MTDRHADRRREVDAVVLGGTLITVDQDRRVIVDGAIAVDAGRIVAVGRRSHVEREFTSDRCIDAGASVVTPGFVDAHVHLSHHLCRSLLPDVWDESREHDLWLPYWLAMTEADALTSALLACVEMVGNGTTTFCDMSGRFSGELQAAAARQIGLRGIVSEICWDVPPHAAVAIGDTEECLARLDSLARRFPRDANSRVWAAVGLSGMGKASDALLVGAKEIAAGHGVPMYMHQSFADSDTEAFEARTAGRTTVEHLEHLGLLGDDLQLVHMNRVRAVEIAHLARSGTHVVHCPGASVRWGLGSSRLGQVPEMVDAAVNVALGSDSGNYADAFDVLHQAYLAATIHREQRGGTPVISAETAIEMATINGARALGVADQIGSIEVGKRADLVLHSTDRAAWHPGLDPVTSLIYAARSSGVTTVLVDGQVVVDNRRCTLVDEAAVYERVDRSAASLLARIGFDVPVRWPTTSSG